MIVSNHGGRQLDTCYPTARALPAVVRAVGGSVPVLVDGGIRRGADIVKAICMGAAAVLVGRAYAYRTRRGGRRRRARAISILRADSNARSGCLAADRYGISMEATSMCPGTGWKDENRASRATDDRAGATPGAALCGDFRDRVVQRPRRGLQPRHFLWPQLDLDVALDACAPDD